MITRIVTEKGNVRLESKKVGPYVVVVDIGTTFGGHATCHIRGSHGDSETTYIRLDREMIECIAAEMAIVPAEGESDCPVHGYGNQ